MAAIFLFLLLHLILHSSQVIAQQRGLNITLGSYLSPFPTKNSYWLSSSGKFAFGFYPYGNGFAVGIWYSKIQPRTVIWTANRDEPPWSGDAIVNLTSNGGLILIQQQHQEQLIPATGASSASIRDSGNFVVYDSDSRSIWQSFDSSTDTLLPGQRLLPGTSMFASISVGNHSTGKFQLRMQEDGNLVQYHSLQGPITPNDAYWQSSTAQGGNNVTLNLDEKGKLYLLNSTGFSLKVFHEGNDIQANILYRVTIDADGIFRLYSLDQDRNGNWRIQWSSTNNKCDPKGICNPNEYCTLMDQEAVCTCLPGFDTIDKDQNNLGCRRNFEANVCLGNSNHNVEYKELSNVAWDDQPYSIISNVSIDGCRDECTKDCNCEAAVYLDQQCQKLKLPVQYGKFQLTVQVTTLIKTGSEMREKGSKNDHKMKILITGAVTTNFAFLALATVGILVYRFRARNYKRILDQEKDGGIADFSLRSFKYAELEKVTNGFIEEVGRGGFGTVFKGILSDEKTVVAVKRLEVLMAESEREFQNEMKVIGRTHHRNLVRLLGYCHEGTNRLLIYEFMRNGSLADFFFKSETKPSWDERIGTALDIARGILYLHDECETQIIHCDIKPENVLMDEKHCAKIADFGLAKLLLSYQTKTYTGVRGTRGYVAPEWHKNLPITTKADVYSFGIMLMEIICFRRSLNVDAPEEQVILAEWVYDCFEGNELKNLVQDEEVDMGKLERMVRVGLWCIQDEPSLRPKMNKVVLMLEGTVDIPIPPSPTSFLSSI